MTAHSLISTPSREAALWLKQQLPGRARLSADSRTIAAGDVFFAYPGETVDGRAHIGRALAAGAAAIVLERDGAELFDHMLGAAAAPSLRVQGLRRRAGELAAAYLDEPTASLTVVAVTGTNGKTSCTHWIAQGCNDRAGVGGDGQATAKAAVIGTLGAGVPGDREPAPATLTTPDAVALQQKFAEFVSQGLELVALEASSIGLQQGRLNGTRIGVAVLTNLTRDHLDYHVTMQAYAEAKARLFSWPTLVAVVVNLEDAASAEMLNAADPDLRRIGYLVNDVAVGTAVHADSIDPGGPDTGAAPGSSTAGDASSLLEAALAEAGERSDSCSDLLTLTPIEGEQRVVLAHFRARRGPPGPFGPFGSPARTGASRFEGNGSYGDGDAERDRGSDGDGDGDDDDAGAGAESVDLSWPLIGRFNKSNALAVAGVWISLGWPLADVAAQLEKLRPVPGRLQVVGDPEDLRLPLAVVDYAHTPDALANALQALRDLARRRGGRLWCVFGAGGDRDAGKRGPMAAGAQAHADVLVLTSDNPRSEEPAAIIAQLRAGLSRAPHLVEEDRARAIAAALRAADAADVVLIAGKGHEVYQEIGGRRLPFSDVEQARLALQSRASDRASGNGGGVAARDAPADDEDV